MSFRLELSGKHYQETVEQGWGKPTIITRKASVSKENPQGLVGISQLTNLFFERVQEHTGRSINHNNFLDIPNSPNFVAVKLQNLNGAQGWEEKPSSSYLGNGAELTKWTKMMINPELNQKEFPCSEAMLIEKSQRINQDMPDTTGVSSYVLDTIHEWTLILMGMNQTQTLTLRIDIQEANF